jgi:hypothetical protein
MVCIFDGIRIRNGQLVGDGIQQIQRMMGRDNGVARIVKFLDCGVEVKMGVGIEDM